MRFYQIEPSIENYWRGIILFGRNVASYKFALASALYEIKNEGSDVILLEDLAIPFSEALCRHIRIAPKQITLPNSKFLTACSQFNNGEMNREKLTEITVRLGFNNVIDAFHNINQSKIDKLFFIDERKKNNGIRITDNFYKLIESEQYGSFYAETEARWKLVEQAWEMGISKNLINIEYDNDGGIFFRRGNDRRVDISSCRDSLNGYQKGRCFYCYAKISLQPGNDSYADVDHFIPRKTINLIPNIDGVWNLVLSCQGCNRGTKGKFARLPTLNLLNRLRDRNDYLINSHLPLRETLIRQTGNTSRDRQDFLNTAWNNAFQILFHLWEPPSHGVEVF